MKIRYVVWTTFLFGKEEFDLRTDNRFTFKIYTVHVTAL